MQNVSSGYAMVAIELGLWVTWVVSFGLFPWLPQSFVCESLMKDLVDWRVLLR